MKNFSIFEKFDQALEQGAEKVVEHNDVSNIIEQTKSLSDEQYQLLSFGINTFFLILPIIGLFALGYSTYSLKNEKEMRINIVSEAKLYDKLNRSFQSSVNKVVTRSPNTNQADLRSRLQSTLNSTGISADSFRVASFDEVSRGSKTLLAKADIRFEKVETKSLKKVIESLVASEKMNLISLQVDRDTKNSLLRGVMVLKFLTKVKN